MNLLGVALSVAAVVLVVSRGSSTVLSELSFERGDVILLCAQAAWVVYQLYSRMATSTLPPVWIMAAPLGWTSVAYGVTVITLSHLWFYAAIRTIGAGRAGEAIHSYHVVAAVVVIGGVYLTTRQPATWWS